MTCRTERTHPLWDSLRKRDALEQAERRDRRVERQKLAPEFRKERDDENAHRRDL